MNIIEEKFRCPRIAIKELKKIKKTTGKDPRMVIETLHFITPANDNGLSILRKLDKFQDTMEMEGAIVIREFGIDISIGGAEDQITKSINLSKKNIQDMIVKHKLVTESLNKPDLISNRLIKTLASDSLPH